MSLKRSVIEALGLQRLATERTKTANGVCERGRYAPVHLELMDRNGEFSVMEVPEEVPNLLGQVPLEELDLVVDCKNQRLVGNPAHGGEWMTEMYPSES